MSFQVKQVTGKSQRGQDIVLVVLTLFHAKDDSWRVQLIHHEALGRVRHVQLALSTGSKNFQWVVIGITQAQLVSYT